MRKICMIVLTVLLMTCALFTLGCDESDASGTPGTQSCSHSFGAWKATAMATCTADGTRTRTCSLCGYTENETIAASGHTKVTDAAQAATCKKEGKTAGSHCGSCGVIIVEQQAIAKKSHVEGSDGVCTACGTDVFMEKLKAGLHIKLVVPKVGSDKNYYCQVKYTNNTEYTIVSGMKYARINGELLNGFNAAVFVLNPNQYTVKSYYTALLQSEIYDEENKDLYLDKESEGYVVVSVNGRDVFVWIGTSGPITFGYSLADIGVY